MKVLKDGRTIGWKDNGQKVITISHPENSSGELNTDMRLPFLLIKTAGDSHGLLILLAKAEKLLSSFFTGVSQISYFKVLLWQPKKMAIGH